MKSLIGHPAYPVSLLLLLGGDLGVRIWAASVQEPPHLSITQPGGMPGQPMMTGINRGSNSVTVTWDGPSGYYQLYKKSALSDSKWQAVGGPSLARRATIVGTNAMFFRVTGPGPHYGGARACQECHQNIYATEAGTAHAHAFDALKQAQQDKNPGCLPCHTVGYGLPSGFISQAATPHLAGVQCENCHGSAGNHAANETDPTVRPRVELASTVCGGCHSVPQSPTYPEWNISGHAQVAKGALAAMNSSSGNLSGCGRCHSGSVRVSLLNGDSLPTGDANVGITCAVCHDPHQTTPYPAQLRNPLASTNDYFMSPTASFPAQYNAKIGVCAQCHNHAGASWSNSSAPPHFSPQYNFLLGTVGELASGLPPNQPATHALHIENQCLGCHMQTSPHQAGPPEVAAITGHTFRVDTYEMCLDCHPFPEMLADFARTAITSQIQAIKGGLDLWATTLAPEPLRSKYGALAWEYTNPGRLSNPTGAAVSGPTAAEQALIPVPIRKARFNLYLVLNDGSYGVHNGPFATTLLDAARNWVQEELNQ